MIQTPDKTAILAELNKTPWWMKLAPPFIREKFAKRVDFIGASDSFIWLSLDTGFLVGLAFVVNILLARFLGPEKYGYYSYLIAFFSVFLPIGKLGLPSIIVRNLARFPNERNTLLGTSFTLRFVAGFITLLSSTLVMFILRPQDQISQLLISFLGLMVIIQSFEVIDYYFQSQLKLKKLTLYKLVAIVLSVILKIVAIVFGMPLEVILFLATVEAALIAIAYITTYSNFGSFTDWEFDFSLAKKLLRQGFPLLLSSIVIMGYAQADQLFLNYFKGSEQLAQYSVAIIIINGLTILPMIIQKAVAPILMKANQEKQATLFNHQIQQLYRLVTIVSIVIGTILVAFGPFVIKLLYGQAYAQAGQIMMLLPFRFFFISIGMIRSLFVVSHGLFDYDLFTNIAAVVVSVTFSILLIPLYGIYGLLIASLLSFITATFGMDLFHKTLRTNAKLAFMGVLTPHEFSLE